MPSPRVTRYTKDQALLILSGWRVRNPTLPTHRSRTTLEVPHDGPDFYGRVLITYSAHRSTYAKALYDFTWHPTPSPHPPEWEGGSSHPEPPPCPSAPTPSTPVSSALP